MLINGVNFFLSLLVLYGSATMSSRGSRHWSGHAFYYDGRKLKPLDTILMPNIGNTTLTLLVNSPYELRRARIDSSETGLCPPDASMLKKLKLRGRWYMILWKTNLRVGSSQHTLYMETFSGRRHKESFHVNVEGSMKENKPRGANR